MKLELGENNIGDGDYTLVDGAGWFATGGFAIRIYTTDEEVRVDIYKDGDEMSQPLAGAYVFFEEVEP